MVKKRILQVVIAIAFLWAGYACSSKKTVPSATTDATMGDDYYLSIKGGEARLAALMTGSFSCHSVNKGGLWLVNSGQDSMVLYGCSLGEVAKDGYWIYHEIVMTHLPSEPMVQTIYNIEQVAPDSLILWKYKINDKKQLSNIHQKDVRPIDKNNIRPHSCTRFVKKRRQTDFFATVQACVSKTADGTVWFDEYYQYVPQHIMQDITQWSDSLNREESFQVSDRSVLYFKRLPKDWDLKKLQKEE